MRPPSKFNFLLGYYSWRIKQPDAKAIIMWYQHKCRFYNNTTKKGGLNENDTI